MKLHLCLCLAAGLVIAAGLPVTGPLKVKHEAGRVIEVGPGRTTAREVWYPASPASAPFPLLLFAPGFGNRPAQYVSQLEDLASHGYVIVALEPAPDRLASLESRAELWAEDLVAAKQEVLRSPMHQIIDSGKVGAFGHSLGGRAAAAMCLLDPTVRACLNQDGGGDDVRLRRPYWPISGRKFAGAFAMLDWFDPGVDDADLRAMHRTREQYASSRLEVTGLSLATYRDARRGAYRITILTPGMRHTAFTDELWSGSASPAPRAHYADCLNQIRLLTRAFFDIELKGADRNSLCGPVKGAYVQCFPAVDSKNSR